MNTEELTERISPKAPKAWLLTEIIGDVVGVIILIILFYLDAYFGWADWIGWILIGIAILSAVSIIYSSIEPKYLYKSWRYRVDEEFFQCKYGVWREKWITVPMSKIQSVSTEQGPILRKYQLRTIKVETMGSSHAIPALDEEVALRLREEIAEYAKLKEVEV
ncbi:PH domain-containing protein [Gracilibacillus oryzae]|uniref:PH domain-containing protein n=1 Tax=Gracilibacillus oryzae TaxID=1672701 RepID=A0A7C8GRA3_9BACI|nr:PH domain-containing protein [Gracilibacillus oryzae]KAB8127931.1 PH domain-containing protein [Gracilibacillus oryzae]